MLRVRPRPTRIFLTTNGMAQPLTTAPPNPRKRSADHMGESSTPQNKTPKLFSIFKKTAPDDSPSTFSWEPPLGPTRTCLYGRNLSPTHSPKVAAFDLDGCLIQSSFVKKAKGSAQAPNFQWWRPGVPNKLREVHQDGFSIVIITNQALRGSEAIATWKKKIPLIGAALSDVPFHILAATAKDGYRKPIPGMWYELERIFAEHNVKIDKTISLFVGDAAGRKGDHASTDRKWALNVGIPFLTPEEYFLGLKPADFTLPGFHVSSLPSNLPAITPTSTPLLPQPGSPPEIMLFVGFPALGKSSFYRKYFQPSGYIHVNQDTLRTRAKCIKAVEEAIKAGESCAVDNTNRDVSTRKYYVDLAKKLDTPIRCILFSGSLELAWHNNLYRAYNLPEHVASKVPKRDLLPYGAFTSFQQDYEEPTITEGFSEVKKVNWIFEGDDEERRRWSMWLQIDGK